MCLLLLVLIAGYSRAKKYGLPLILGGIVMAVTLAMVDLTTVGQGNVLGVAIVPATLAGLLSLTLNRLAAAVRDPDDGARESTGDVASVEEARKDTAGTPS